MAALLFATGLWALGLALVYRLRGSQEDDYLVTWYLITTGAVAAAALLLLLRHKLNKESAEQERLELYVEEAKLQQDPSEPPSVTE